VTTLDPTFGRVIWNAYKSLGRNPSALRIAPRQRRFNRWKCWRKCGLRLGRHPEHQYTTGSGANHRKGIVHWASAGVTAASATAIAFDELIDLEKQFGPKSPKLPGVG